MEKQTEKKKAIRKKHFLRLRFWYGCLIYLIKKKRANILYSGGIHFITGATAAGKTLLASILIDRLCKDEKDFFWSNIDEFQKEKTKVFEIRKIFGEGTQKMRLNNYYCKGVIFDEVNLEFNRRLNNRASYNDLFMGLQKLSVSHRHQGLPRIYYIGQALELQDTQLQSIFKFLHIVSKSQRFSFYFFKKDNVIKEIPKMIYISSFIKQDDTKTYIPIKKQKIQITEKMLERYDTFGFSKQFDDLPIYSG